MKDTWCRVHFLSTHLKRIHLYHAREQEAYKTMRLRVNNVEKLLYKKKETN